MRPVIDPLNLILLIIVIFIGLKLRSVLGTRNDDESSGSRANAYRLNRDAFENDPKGGQKPENTPASEAPQTPEARETHETRDEAEATQTPDSDNIAPAQAVAEPVAPVLPHGRGPAYLREVEPDFDEAEFLDGAERAYPMILSAFANGDLTSVREFLGAEVAGGFEAAIADRQQNDRQLVTRILRLDRPVLDDARVDDGVIQLDVRFRAEIISFTGSRGVAIDEDKLPPPAMIQDIWTFERRRAAQDSNWSLVATQSS